MSNDQKQLRIREGKPESGGPGGGPITRVDGNWDSAERKFYLERCTRLKRITSSCGNGLNMCYSGTAALSQVPECLGGNPKPGQVRGAASRSGIPRWPVLGSWPLLMITW